MTFAHQLTKAAGDCTAAEAATAVSALLSRRTMEDWLQGRRTPPEWTHDFILARVSARARRKSRRPQNIADEGRAKRVPSGRWLGIRRTDSRKKV